MILNALLLFSFVAKMTALCWFVFKIQIPNG